MKKFYTVKPIRPETTASLNPTVAKVEYTNKQIS